MNRPNFTNFLTLPVLAILLAAFPTIAQEVPKHPWSDPALSPDVRADLVLKEMTLDEKIDLLHGNGMPGWPEPKPRANASLGNNGAGFVLGVPRLGIPIVQMSDAAYGVRASGENGRYSTALPSNVASAASWDPKAACAYGALIGRELRAQGYNMTLGGGTNLTREPRNGRTFEYMGEDPILAGTLVGNRIKCEQAQHVIGDIKHYALNDQEAGRLEVNVLIGKRAMRESDLLAFQIGIEIGNPGAVMCSYNAVNGDYACESKYLLTDVLRKSWNFKGFVVSDWAATHSTIKASAAGLDIEQPLDLFYGEPFKQAVKDGKISMDELNTHVHRILRAEFATGIVDFPMQKSVIDVELSLDTARRLAEQSIVLLKNDKNLLPLDRGKLHSIAIIGANADKGMLTGGGSAQVDPPGIPNAGWQAHVWFPPAPLKSIRAAVPGVEVQFDSGAVPAEAASIAKQADVAIIFAHQWTSEDMDLKNLSLPDQQDLLIEQVASANPHTIVVLESGTAVTMPWHDKSAAILEAWYPGSKGAEAVANILFGVVNPSAKLPMTFPRSESDLPHPKMVIPSPADLGPAAVMRTGVAKPTFEVRYDEGLKVGYKWYDAEKKPVLFPFGFGLSYTSFAYSNLRVTPGKEVVVTFSLKNTGSRTGDEVAQVYAALPASADEPPKRLVGWSKVHLNAGESTDVSVSIDPRFLSIYNETKDNWELVPGSYSFMAGGSSQDLPLTSKLDLH